MVCFILSMRTFVSLLVFSWLFSCQTTAPPPGRVSSRQIIQQKTNAPVNHDKPYVIMVSLDGFRYDYAEKYNASNLLAMAANGFSVEQLVPSYPTKTFPNHYSLVTGMYPSSHGLVSNEYYNPTLTKASIIR